MPDKDKRTYGSTRNKEPTQGTERQGRFVLASGRIRAGMKRWTSMQLRVTEKFRRGKKSMGKSEIQRKIPGSDRTVIEFDSEQAGKRGD